MSVSASDVSRLGSSRECDLHVVPALMKADSNLIVSGTHAVLDGEPEPRHTKTAVVVEEVKDATAFAALRPHWNDLLRASSSDNPFLTWEWQHTWWNHLRESSALRVLLVRADAELVAIAPLRLVTSPWHRFSRLELLGTGHAGSDYLDLIIRRGRETESVTALAQYFEAQQLCLRFNHLSPSSLAAQLSAALATDGWISASADDGACPIIPLAGHTFDSYLATLGSSHRANVRRRIKAVGQQFDIRFDRVITHRERQDALTALATWSERRWKDAGGSTAFITPAVRAFQDRVTARAFEQGWLLMYVLRLNDEAAAVMYGFHYGRRFYFYQHGFDDRYKAQSLGLVLMGLTIRAVIDEGAREFDMLWGVEPYKFLWAREVSALQRIELFPPTIAGALQRRAIEVRRKAGTLTRQFLSMKKAASAGSHPTLTNR
jgi:CelD/BcsL family acetyltransferase involved in cellulose biosynthesis